MSFDNDLKGKFISVTRAKKWSKKNRYDRFSVQRGAKPVIERLTTGNPDWVDCTYEFICVTNYTEQMNKIIEVFSYHENTYFGTGTDYQFLSKVEGESGEGEGVFAFFLIISARKVISSYNFFSSATTLYIIF